MVWRRRVTRKFFLVRQWFWGFINFFFYFFYRIDEILADSDSDMDEDNKDKSKKKKKHDTYIQETPESIVDLADINSIGKITSKSHNF